MKVDIKSCDECPKTKTIYYQSTMGVKTSMGEFCSFDKNVKLNKEGIPDNCPLKEG